jgi:hypothetical protein
MQQAKDKLVARFRSFRPKGLDAVPLCPSCQKIVIAIETGEVPEVGPGVSSTDGGIELDTWQQLQDRRECENCQKIVQHLNKDATGYWDPRFPDCILKLHKRGANFEIASVSCMSN